MCLIEKVIKKEKEIRNTTISNTRQELVSFWRSKIVEQNRNQRLKLKKQKANIESYYGILRAVGAGKSLPREIISNTKVPWLTVMQCLRTLEQNGLVTTVCDVESQRRLSKLTEKGFELLNQILQLDNSKFRQLL